MTEYVRHLHCCKSFELCHSNLGLQGWIIQSSPCVGYNVRGYLSGSWKIVKKDRITFWAFLASVQVVWPLWSVKWWKTILSLELWAFPTEIHTTAGSNRSEDDLSKDSSGARCSKVHKAEWHQDRLQVQVFDVFNTEAKKGTRIKWVILQTRLVDLFTLNYHFSLSMTCALEPRCAGCQVPSARCWIISQNKTKTIWSHSWVTWVTHSIQTHCPLHSQLLSLTLSGSAQGISLKERWKTERPPGFATWICHLDWPPGLATWISPLDPGFATWWWNSLLIGPLLPHAHNMQPKLWIDSSAVRFLRILSTGAALIHYKVYLKPSKVKDPTEEWTTAIGLNRSISAGKLQHTKTSQNNPN